MVCYYCQKPLHINKTTMDHYYPKNLGGTLDVHNVVTCCKRCNSYKKSRVPEDWEAVNVRLFIQGVIDGKIVSIHHSTVEQTRMIGLARQVYRVDMDKDEDHTVFYSKAHCFSVKNNRIYKVEENKDK